MSIRFSSIKNILSCLCILISYGSKITFAETDKSKKHKLATQIADNYIRSFSTKAEEEKDNIAFPTKKNTPDHEIRPATLDAATIRKVIFNNILTKGKELSLLEEQRESILNEYAWADLKLFYGTTTEPAYNLMSRINRTNTIIGEAALTTLLVTPTSNIEVLHYRQNILRTFLNNKEQTKKLDEHLRTYKDAEQSMISFWTTTDPLFTKEYRKYMEGKFYAKGGSSSNKSATWLEFKKRLSRDFISIQLPMLWPVIFPTYMEIFKRDFLVKDIYSGIAITNRKLFWTGAIPYYGGWYKWRKVKLYEPALSDLTGIFNIMAESFYTWTAYLGITNYLEYSSVLQKLALRMADTQVFIKSVENINKIILHNPALEKVYGKNLVAIRELLAESKKNTELGKLIRYLQDLPFNNWSYFFNNAGKLLACHTLFVEHKEAFSDAIYEIGKLDAYLSFATLMQEASAYNGKHAYTFVQFLDREKKNKPYIKMEEMWNPFMDSKQAVGNSVEMDGAPGGVRNIILTGPNAGGKSTFLTGVTHTLLLAHVIGVGPADNIVLTPFNKINTYIDIADDIAAGKSLFMAEVDRAQKHIKILEELQQDEFSFTIFDEPFSGTNPIEGAAAEYSILESIANHTNSITMVATHYPTVMLLEEKAKDKGFANYKVYITRKEGVRKFNYTYKIIPGKSTQAIAIDILEEQGYDTKMLARAREIIEHPERYQAKF